MVPETHVWSEQLLDALLEPSIDVILLISLDGTIFYASPSVTSVTGYAPDELIGVKKQTLIHPDDLEEMSGHIAGLIERAEGAITLEYRLRCKDGSWRWMESTANYLLDSPRIGAVVCTTRDITRRKHLLALYHEMMDEWRCLEQRLSYAEQKFRSLAESNIVGMMVTDQSGRMYEVNDHVVQLLGYSREELLNGSMRVGDLVTPETRRIRTRAWKTLIAHGASLPEEKDYVRKDGTIVPMLVAATAINQERTRALVMLLDISDRKEAERRKQEFLSMVSHELRTPLTAIQGFVELALLCLERLSVHASQETASLLSNLENILQQTLRQTELEARLVSELLDVSRMEAQHFEICLQPCNLVTLVQRVVANQQQVAPTRCIELVLPEQDQVPVMADADRIEQVLTNYLTNAFKYSPADQPVQVCLSVEGYAARVRVRDRGPGLTAEEQQRIWDRFYQIKTARRQGTDGGLGLGLYIVRTIIAQHQGQVGVESCPGHGATFWFLLPLADEPPQG
jgi:PAS domain S-box-containing protein